MSNIDQSVKNNVALGIIHTGDMLKRKEKLFFIFAIITLCYLMRKTICKILQVMGAQGQPLSKEVNTTFCNQESDTVFTTDINVEERKETDFKNIYDELKKDSQDKPPNIWLKPMRMVVDSRTDNMTLQQLHRVVNKNLVFLKFHDYPTNRHNICNALYISNNCWLLPWHVVCRNYTEMEFIYHSEGLVGQNHKCRINMDLFYRIGLSDIAIMYVESDCPRQSVLDYFHDDKNIDISHVLITYKKCDGLLIDSHSSCKKTSYLQKVNGMNISYDASLGHQYECTFPTFSGLCGAIAISSQRKPFIYGMHIAGITGKTTGFSTSVTRSELQQAIDNFFSKNPRCMKLHNQGEIQLEYPEFNITVVDKPAPRSPLNFCEEGAQIQYLGSHTGITRTFRSEVQRTLISEDIEEMMGITNMHGPPRDMNSWKHWQKFLTDVSHLTSVDSLTLNRAFKDLTDEFDLFSKDIDLNKRIFILEDDVNLSGLDGVSGIEPINLSSSMGWPWNKPKKNFMYHSGKHTDHISDVVVAEPWIWEKVAQCEDKLAAGERIHLINRCNLKDEPTKLTKEKVRVFSGTPVVGLLLIRKYFLSICKLFMDYPIQFECAVGINVYSEQWTKLTKAMIKYGEDNMIAGDYKSYDTSMSSRMSLTAMNYFIYIAKKAGYDERTLNIMRGLSTEICFPLYELNGDYISISGSNPSGHSLTVFVNNIVNSLYLRLAYYGINPRVERPFKSNVSVVCYGDDNKMSVNKKCPWFNHTAIATYLATFGVTYTMADKEATSIPFISNVDCSFLKRNSVWSDRYECYLPPIEKATIHKILHCHMKSKFLTPEESCVEAIKNALRELFFYGEEEYNHYKNHLDVIITKHKLNVFFDTRLTPTFTEMEYWFLKNYHPKLLEHKFPQYKDDVFSLDEYKMELLCENRKILNNYINVNKTSDVYKLMAQGLCENQDNIHGYQYMKEEVVISYARLYIVDSDLYRMPYLGLSPYLIRFIGLIQSVNLNKCIAKNYNNEYIKMSGKYTKETVDFNDGNEQIVNTISHTPDPTFMGVNIDDVKLQNFLERPVLIKQWDWSPTITLSDTINPWTLFFANSRVSNRLSNFYLLHCKLNVKFVINGNPFYYGRLMVDYQPLYQFDNCTSWDPTEPLNLVAASQRLHLLIDPCTSKAGTLILPYLLNTNAANLPAGNIEENGILHLRTMAELQHANGSTSSLTISAYAWLTDVKMSIPTHSNISSLVAQSDEYETDATSNKLSNSAEIVGKLNDVPVIGPYAKSTQMLLKGMSLAAKALGFCKPLCLDDIHLMKPQYLSHLAATNVKDNSMKLAVDVKNELSIDPRTFGLSNIDELSINYIATLESFLTNFAWTPDNVSGDLLMNMRVRPQYFPNDGSYTYMPACSFAALPFKYWRGSMKYRFEVVCSDLHKGRLKIVYDPYLSAETPEENVQYTQILDLADRKDMCIEVGWAQPLSYLETRTVATSDPGFSLTRYTNSSTGITNGILSVYVLNVLTLPSDTTNSISINLYVSMGNDCEFAVPDMGNYQSTHYKYTEAFEAQSGEYCDEQCADPIMNSMCAVVADELPVDDATTSIYMGEKVTSYRQLLKRFCYLGNYLVIPEKDKDIYGYRLTNCDFPIYRGILPTGSDEDGTFNRVYTTLLNYLAPAFLIYRGSLRQKYVISNYSDSYGTLALLSRSRLDNIITFTFSWPIDTDSQDLLRESMELVTSNIYNGATATIVDKQCVLEAELPFYYNRRFKSAKDRAMNTDARYNPYTLCHDVDMYLRYDSDKDITPILHRYVSVGEDFTLAGFQGAPPITTATFS